MLILDTASDEALVQAICGQKQEREQALAYFFHHKTIRQNLLYYVNANGGNSADGEDVFQDTMIIFDKNIRAKKYEGNSSLVTYFVAIAKWHWTSLKRQRQKIVVTDTFLERADDELLDIEFFKQEKKILLEQILSQIGERCKTLLTYYKLSYSMQEIAEAYGLSSAEMAKKETYRCREKMKNYIQQNPYLIPLLK